MSNGANSKPKLVDTGQKSWQNAHVTYTQPLRHFYDLWNPTEGDSFDRYNATTSAIMDLIGQVQTENLGLRALGGGWSLSRAPATDGILVNTKLLNLFFRMDADLVEKDVARADDRSMDGERAVPLLAPAVVLAIPVIHPAGAEIGG